MNKSFSNLFKKLKSIKHIEVILALLIGVIILLVYFSSTSSNSYSSNNKTQISSYTTEIEYKLSNILSQIDGAGNVSVMVMTQNNGEAENEDVNITSVIVVASGADDVNVKLNIIKAVQTLLKINSADIEVLEGGGKI